jgi:hypothetical protein
VFDAHRGARVTIQRRLDERWRWVASVALDRRGHFAWSTRSAGRYRAVYGGLPGPPQTLSP